MVIRIGCLVSTTVTLACSAAGGHSSGQPDGGDSDSDTGSDTSDSGPIPDAGESFLEPLFPSFSRIGGGYGFTCYLADNGGVACWGANESGQHGNGTASFLGGTALSWVEELPDGADRLCVGKYHACLLSRSDPEKGPGEQVWCWGRIDTASSTLPEPIEGLDGDAATHAAATGSFFHCVLGEGGAVRCWGDNTAGQIGDGTYDDTTAPVGVVGLESGVRSIGLGNQHACAVTEDTGIWCWGINSHGQLGNGTVGGMSNVPTPVVGLDGMEDDVIKIVGGSMFTCALMHGGSVFCWGGNEHGELGNDGEMGDGMVSLTPVQVVGLDEPVVDVSSGCAHICVLMLGGTVKCWGGNLHGNLGNDSTSNSAIPVDVVGLDEQVVAIGVGHEHSCAVTIDEDVWCWGFNQHGQLGDGTESDSKVPVQVIGFGG